MYYIAIQPLMLGKKRAEPNAVVTLPPEDAGKLLAIGHAGNALRVVSSLMIGNQPHNVGDVLPLSDFDEPDEITALLKTGAVEAIVQATPTKGGGSGSSSPAPDISPEDQLSGDAGEETQISPLTFLNQANQAELETLPHVGPATAEKLIAARPFTSLDAAQTASDLTEAKWAEVVAAVEEA